MKKKIVAIILFIFVSLIALYFFLENYYIPGKIVFLRNDGIYMYQNFRQPKKLIAIQDLLKYPGGFIKLSPNGKNFVYSYNKNRKGTPYFDLLVYNIYDIESGKIYPLQTDKDRWGILN